MVKMKLLKGTMAKKVQQAVLKMAKSVLRRTFFLRRYRRISKQQVVKFRGTVHEITIHIFFSL